MEIFYPEEQLHLSINSFCNSFSRFSKEFFIIRSFPQNLYHLFPKFFWIGCKDSKLIVNKNLKNSFFKSIKISTSLDTGFTWETIFQNSSSFGKFFLFISRFSAPTHHLRVRIRVQPDVTGPDASNGRSMRLQTRKSIFQATDHEGAPIPGIELWSNQAIEPWWTRVLPAKFSFRFIKEIDNDEKNRRLKKNWWWS